MLSNHGLVHQHALLASSGSGQSWRSFSPSDLATFGAEDPKVVVGVDDAWVSPRFSPKKPFRDLIGSWNLEVPAGAGAIIELAVGSAADTSRSAWMRLGVVGALPERVASEGIPISTIDGGRVDVDIFRAECDHRFAEIRIRAFAGSVSIRSFVLAATFRGVDESENEATDDWKGEAARLPVPFRSQQAEAPEIRSRICSPTSVSMVMEFRGIVRDTSEVARQAYDHDHDLYGNWPRNVQAAFEFGLRGFVARLSGWEQVRDLIEQGAPVVISIAAKEGQLSGAPYRSTAGHLLVITGFSPEGDVHVNDPAAQDEATGVVTYRRRELSTVWLDRGGTSYVLSGKS